MLLPAYSQLTLSLMAFPIMLLQESLKTQKTISGLAQIKGFQSLALLQRHLKIIPLLTVCNQTSFEKDFIKVVRAQCILEALTASMNFFQIALKKITIAHPLSSQSF